MAKGIKKGSAFGNLGDMMGMEGMSSVLSAVGDASRPTFALVKRDDIKLYKQQRDEGELESEEQTLDELAADMELKGILQPIILCENEEGPEPWRLVAGERRYHGSGLADIDDLPSMCYGKLTEQQIKDIQLAENIHRLNLSQMNEARVLKQRLDDEFEGNAESLCEAISKSRSWVSKRLSLLDLPEQTQRLVKEGVTADIEVINQVKTIEKIDPDAAKETVDTLKTEKGEKGANARKTVKAAKDKVKPPSKPKKGGTGEFAQPKDLSHQEHGSVNTVPPETLESDPALIELQHALATEQEQIEAAEGRESIDWLDAPPVEAQGDADAATSPESATDKKESPDPFGVDMDGKKVLGIDSAALLDQAYTQIHGGGEQVATEFLAGLSRPDRSQLDDWLCEYYEAGVDCENLALTVINGLRSGKFAKEGHGAFALAAFLTGGEEGAVFNLVNVLGYVK